MNHTGYELSALAADEDVTFGRPVSYGTATPAQREAHARETADNRVDRIEVAAWIAGGALTLLFCYLGWLP